MSKKDKHGKSHDKSHEKKHDKKRDKPQGEKDSKKHGKKRDQAHDKERGQPDAKSQDPSTDKEARQLIVTTVAQESKEDGEEKKEEEKEQLHPPETVTSILLIRHGHTEATERGLLYSDSKMPMSDKGVEQSKRAAQWAVNFKPDVIVTGTAVRVVEAANPLATLTNLNPVVVKGFEEWHVGKWEGRTYLDIKKNDPKEYEAWSLDPVNNAPPGGESIDDLVQRIGRSLRHLIIDKQFHGKRIAMVTHSGIIRSMIVQALDMPVSNFWRISIPTGSISRIDFSRNFATLQFSALVPEKLICSPDRAAATSGHPSALSTD